MKLRICLSGMLLELMLSHTAARAQASNLIDGVVTKVDASAQAVHCDENLRRRDVSRHP